MLSGSGVRSSEYQGVRSNELTIARLVKAKLTIVNDVRLIDTSSTRLLIVIHVRVFSSCSKFLSCIVPNYLYVTLGSLNCPVPRSEIPTHEAVLVSNLL